MNFRAMKLIAPVAALATLGLVACGEPNEPEPTLIPPSTSGDPTAMPPESAPLPAAPPEVIAPGEAPQAPLNPNDPTAPPPGSPPPILPDSPPN